MLFNNYYLVAMRSLEKESKKEFADIFQTILGTLDITPYRIAKTLGVGAGPIERLKTGTKPSYDTLVSILDAYPQLNPDFVLFGEGTVLRDGNAKQIGIFGDMDFEDVAYLPIKAYAGFIATYEESTPIKLEKYPVLKTTTVNHKNCLLVEVNGNSMQPTLQHGSKVLTQKIERGYWADVSGVFVILYKDLLVVKRIRENDLNLNSTLTLYSDNRDGGTVTIKGGDIKEVWRVIKVIDQDVQ